MRIIGCLLFVAVLAGCVTSANLIEANGKRYEMKVDPAGKTLSADIDSVKYAGAYITNSSTGFATGQTFGMRPAFSAGTVVMGGNSGVAQLTATNGDFMECQFNYQGVTVMGRCQTKSGREFVLTTVQ